MERNDLVYSMVTSRPLLANNEIEVHRPVFKKTDSKPPSVVEDMTPEQSLQLRDLYQRLKMNFEKSNQEYSLKKRFRNDDQPRLGFDNVNVVIPGQ